EIAVFIQENGINKAHVKVLGVNFPKLGKKPMFQLRLRSIPDCTKFLLSVMPYLRIKRTEAQDVLRARKLWPPINAVQRGLIASEARWRHNQRRAYGKSVAKPSLREPCDSPSTHPHN